MLHLFRKFMSSKLGVVITLAALVLIALAFAVGDVASTGTFGGIAGGDRVAIVGKRKIATSELASAVTKQFQDYRQQNPTATMESYIAGGGMTQTLDQLLNRTAIAEFARMNGLRASDRLVDSEIVQIGAFQGADGKFSDDAYRAALAQQGLSDKMVRSDIAMGLLTRQAILPVSMGNTLPVSLVKHYAALLRERRKGNIGIMLSGAYAPKNDPSAAQLQQYYAAHRTEYLRPERRVIRYATFGDAALKDLRAPTEAEIAARYKRDAGDYAPSETRRVAQMVVPTKAAADAVVKEVSGGKSLAAAAQEKGLAVTQIGPITQKDLSEQASDAVAQAVFSTAEGSIAPPARGGLGFYIMRVESIERKPGRTLAQAHDEIAQSLAAEQRRTALLDLSSEIEDEIDNGSSMNELAKKLGVQIQTVPEVLADGRIYGKPNEKAPAEIARAVSTAFDMREGEPQLTELDPGKTFLMFEVSDVTPSTAAPLAEIKDQLVVAWKRSEGSKAAKEAAERVMQRIKQGQTVAAAMAQEKVALPPPDNINMNREELSKTGARVPPVLALMFSMAKGTTKRLEAPNNNGWFVVKLDDIETSKVADDDPLLSSVSQQLAMAAQDEYSEELVKSITKEVGIERNPDAIAAVEAQLTGKNTRE